MMRRWLAKLAVVSAAAAAALCATNGETAAVPFAGDPFAEATASRNLGKVKKCAKPTQRCKHLKGSCLTVEECRAKYEDEARFIGMEGFCKAPQSSSSTFEPTKCGCCYKKTPDTPDPIDIVGASNINLDFEAQGIGGAFAGDPPNEPDAAKPATWATFSASADPALGEFVLHLGNEDTASAQGPWSASLPGRLEFVCDAGACTAEATGTAHSAAMDDLFPPGESSGATRGDEEGTDKAFESTLIPILVKVKMPADMFGEGVRELQAAGDPSGQYLGRGEMGLEVALLPSAEQRAAGVEPFEAELELLALIDWRMTPVNTINDILIWPWPFFERKRSMCLQPVRTKHRRCLFSLGNWCLIRSAFYTYSGQGLGFGTPGLRQQWGKVDITFQIRDWIDVDDVSGQYQALTEAEMSGLRAEVSTSGCVEIFFVPKFSPSSTYGGGVCWSGGTASAKIITSDEQVACGVDITHLAHEVGHALGLRHPGGSDPDGDAGTLMCPSGWQRDNPRRNSLNNGNSVTSPLLIHYWGFWTLDNHDCTNNADCESCLAHFPPDSC